MKYQILNIKKAGGRMLLLTTVLLFAAAPRAAAQCPALAQVDLQAVSIDPAPLALGVGQTGKIFVTMKNNGPCVIPTGEALAQVTLSSFYLDMGTPVNFTDFCAPPQWSYLGVITTGGLGGQHNLFFQNTGGPIPVNQACFFSFDIKGKVITPAPTNITLASSLSLAATTSDVDGSNQSASTDMNVRAFALPVVMADFTVRSSSCNGIVFWSTATEDNVDRFEVEYSTNGTDYNNVGTVTAKNNPTGSAYQLVHNQGTAKGYYRIKIIDRDGRANYSKVISLETRCSGIKNVTMYPNPLTANQNLSVVASGYNGNIKGELVSVNGQVIRTYGMKNGLNSLMIENLAQGTYMLRVTEVSSGDAESFRVIVIK